MNRREFLRNGVIVLGGIAAEPYVRRLWTGWGSGLCLREATNVVTLADIAKHDPNIATIIEILSQSNEILEDMEWTEGRLSVGSVRFPPVSWRLTRSSYLRS